MMAKYKCANILKPFLVLIIFVLTLAQFAAARDDSSVDPENDSMTELEALVNYDEGIKLVDYSAHIQKSATGVRYLNITFTIINETADLIPALSWEIGFDNSDESISGIEDQAIQPYEEKSYKKLVFGGLIQSAKNGLPTIMLNKTSSTSRMNRALNNLNQLQCGNTGGPLLNTCSGGITLGKQFCTGECLSKGADHSAGVSCDTYIDQKTGCQVTTVNCHCVGISNGGNDLSIPEFTADNSLDPYIRNAILETSPLESRNY